MNGAWEKPCAACPWIKPGRPDLTPELIELARQGAWFCCHGRGCGECAGSAAEHKRAQRQQERAVV